MAEPLNAAFFTFKNRDRAVLLPATVAIVVIIALLVAAFVALNWSAFVGFRDLFLLAGSGERVSDEQSLGFLGRFFALFGWAFLFLFPIYIAIAAYEAACLRWMIRGEAPGLFGLALNNDTWRVWGVYWCWLLAQMVVSIAMSFVMIPVMFMTMGDIMANPTPENMMHWQLAVQLPLTVLQYIPLIFIGIRFGPAAATSVLRNRFSFLDAWTVTRGRFWELFGAFAIWAVVALLGFAVVFVGSIYAQFDGDFGAYWDLVFHPLTVPQGPDVIFERVFSREGMIIMGAGAAVNFAVWLVWALASFGVNARAALAAREEGKISYVPDGP